MSYAFFPILEDIDRARRLHLGKGRMIPADIHPLFHESVKRRMEYAPLKYTPKATWFAGTETYVV